MNIEERVRRIVLAKHGRVEEELTASGIVDSLAAIDLAIELEKEFELAPDSFALADFVTVTRLAGRIRELRDAPA